MATMQRSTFALDKEAWDRLAYFAFRDEVNFDALCDIHPTDITQPGSVVTLTKFTDLAPATTPLTETSDVSTSEFADSKVQVTMAEYGNAVETTRFLHATTYIPLNPVVANVLGYNAGISIDTIARTPFYAGSNVYYSNGNAARNEIVPTDVLAAADVRKVVAKLRGANVPTFGGFYASIVHPDASVDLRTETGAAAWRDPQVYGQSQDRIWNGEIGSFEKVRFAESPRALTVADGGAGTDAATAYLTLVLGKQSVAKVFPQPTGFGPSPRIVDGPVVDKLRRFVPMGWYHLVGYGRFREESIRRIESGSSLDEDYTA